MAGIGLLRIYIGTLCAVALVCRCKCDQYSVIVPLQVKGITGPNKGLIGALINIDEGDGIVKLDADSALKIIALDNLAKYVPRQQ